MITGAVARGERVSCTDLDNTKLCIATGVAPQPTHPWPSTSQGGKGIGRTNHHKTMTNSLNKNVVLHGRAGPFYIVRALSYASPLLQALLDHPLVWNVDWFKVKGGFYAIVDPTNPREIIYLGQKDFRDFIEVALSNREPLVVLARAGDPQPAENTITAPRPKTPHSPVFFRTYRVYSKFLRALWTDLWEGRLVVPSDRNIRYIFCNWSKILLQWLGTSSSSRAQSQGFLVVSMHLLKILRSKGALGLALYLKMSLLCTNKFLAGQPFTCKDTFALKCAMRLTKGGLPVWFPLPIRLALRQKSLKVIRLWVSILYSYKAMYAVGEASLRTITKSLPLSNTGHMATWYWEFQDFVQNVWLPSIGITHRQIPQDTGIPPLRKSAGPSGGTTIAGALRDLWVWRVFRGGALHESLKVILGMTKNHSALGFLEHGLAGAKPDQVFPLKLHKKAKVWPGYDAGVYDGRNPLALGRLHFINEAAGKVRVIAIFDYMSQWAFRPVHDFLLTILSTLYEDGTSSQNLCLERFASRIAGRKGTFYSLDISAATDTIPWQIYEILLGCLCGNYFARHFMRLLRERVFMTPKSMALDFVRYSKGQPMGALSSFPLLGLVHHALVQYAAYQANKFPCREYAIVGDDLIIFEPDQRPATLDYLTEDNKSSIAARYMSICSWLGIKIHLNKSYVSESFFNFISRSFMDGVEVSPASMRAELSVHSLGQRVENSMSNLVRWASGDSRGYAARVYSYVSDHWTWAPFMVSGSYGRLTNYMAVVLTSFFSPGGRSDAAAGMKGTGWLLWMASIRGSTIGLSHDVSQLRKHFLEYNLKSTLTILRTVMLVLRSELESTLVSSTSIADLYVSWLVKQPRPIRLLYPLFREQRENYAYINFSAREVRPLLGFDDAESLMDYPNYEEITGMSFEELHEAYIYELLIYNMGYMVPRTYIKELQNFYESWVAIFKDSPDLDTLEQYIVQAFQAVQAFKPAMDYSDVNCLAKMPRNDFGGGPNHSFNKKRFEYATEGFADRITGALTFALKMISIIETNGNVEQTLKLPLPASS